MAWAVIGRHGGGAWTALDQSEIPVSMPQNPLLRLDVVCGGKALFVVACGSLDVACGRLNLACGGNTLFVVACGS